MAAYDTWGGSWGISWNISWTGGVIQTSNQGAGRGKGKFDRLQRYREIGQAIAKARSEKTLDPIAKNSEEKPKARMAKQALKNEIIEYFDTIPEFTGSKITLKEIEAISLIVEEIGLQEQEDEAIMMLMMMAV